ncbi:transcriptional regulator of acetoin/glycerol metabolism [Streptomyces sp. V3I8]|uniref:helix-turn-helix domain-containing protein n=1 Tax=Streptomyces sp. V3I8 TaxID=3042279 RepID=UPI00277D5197|nr:helix-turn-helix domain-containing protein [Streptomyces sp. V3I8]MDQ1034781.1 transcriptional regulator of acetoin/glycerol metabolism [Streptomyces sp. V3I8]
MTTTNHSPAVPVHPALTSLRQARERFLTGTPPPAGTEGLPGVPEEVAAAWRRARFFGVPHDRRESPRPARATGSPLLPAARPVLERVAPALVRARSALLLTDERLGVLWSGGNAPDDERCRDLSEDQVGHNSAALALRERRRAEVHGPEHFLDLWQEVSAVSVPVLAPENGRVLGTVTVASGLHADRSPHPGAALAEATATAVEAELLTRSRTAERVLLDAYQRAASRPGAAVVALDGRNRLLTEAAAGLLSPAAVEVLERSTDPAHRTHPAPHGHELRLPDGAGTARIARVCHRGAVIGVVAVLEPPPGGGPPAARRSRTGPAGGSVPWRHATARAAELVHAGGPLLLTGERGTGKTTLARELLAAHGVPAPAVVDAAEGPVRALAARLAALTDGAPLLLRHAEELAQCDIAPLNSLLDAHPHVPLLVTHTPGTAPGPCLQRLLDILAARSVALPALRERAQDIRGLLSDLTPGPAPGEPPLTWALDALHALERHPWPGNVTELAHLVRALAERRRTTGPVRRAELPDPVREGPAARPLSPMEHAERTAVLEALRRHGGNKARTAAALGIARATLYRKLRAYRSG